MAERVVGLEAGVYYYSPLQHDLVSIERGQRLAEVWNALEYPEAVEKARKEEQQKLQAQIDNERARTEAAARSAKQALAQKEKAEAEQQSSVSIG